MNLQIEGKVRESKCDGCCGWPVGQRFPVDVGSIAQHRAMGFIAKTI
jgi:hypothetical protein